MLFIFDMGGVVTRDDLFEEKLCAILKMTKAEFAAACGGGNERQNIMKSLSNGEITAAQFWAAFSAQTNAKHTAKEIKADPLEEAFDPVRDKRVEDIINRIRERGERVVCGTNTIEAHYVKHTKRGDYALFDKVYASNIIGISKPDAAFWKTILEAEHTEAKNAFFTDDREENCAAARALGIKTHLFTAANELENAINELL